MTADAKVGLLLGLVFIVLIAFLINGLPGFLNPEQQMCCRRTKNMVSPLRPRRP
jgi:hypothetical protein